MAYAFADSLQILYRDLEFLSKHNHMDYSLVVGIHTASDPNDPIVAEPLSQLQHISFHSHPGMLCSVASYVLIARHIW